MADAYTGKFIKASFPIPHVLLLELNRAPVNAFHEPFWLELGSTFRRIDKDGDVRVVVLASALPKLFTAGIDVSALASTSDPKADAIERGVRLRKVILDFQACISAIEECRQPVIGASHGAAIGLAVDILCACDIRFASSDCVFSIREVDLALAADIGTLARFPKIIGNESMARELAISARNFGAEEALRMGFVSHVIPGSRSEVVVKAIELAKTIASKSPIAVVGTKHLMLHARDHTVRDNLDYTATWNSLTVQSSDLPAAAIAFKNKQKPEYRALPKL
ncbi:ClpP/crotonase [Auricularia subglabra TFB-10046 SS5]|nr:ClpP/crotonase [Auricularia subglabra TFB-10046 SS5]